MLDALIFKLFATLGRIFSRKNAKYLAYIASAGKQQAGEVVSVRIP